MLIVVVGSSDGEAGTQTAVAVAYGCHDNIFRLSDNLPQPHGKTWTGGKNNCHDILVLTVLVLITRLIVHFIGGLENRWSPTFAIFMFWWIMKSNKLLVCLHVCKIVWTVGQQSEQTPVHGFSLKKVISYSWPRGTTLIANRDPQ